MSIRDAEAHRPSPDALLKAAAQEGRGRLKVFLGAAPGVGKTYEMLSDGAERLRAGRDVVVGVVETHGRQETEAMTRPFEIVPRRTADYRNGVLTEMDIDAILERRPDLVLVDELAHTNAPDSRHPKRYQDVEELLTAGIDVYSTINIQHLESLNDVVASFTRVRVRETVPDRVLEMAEIEVVDLPPDELIDRLKAGKVYVPQEASRALNHFFSKSNLSALREMALRRAAQTVDAQMLDYLRAQALAGTFAGGERVVVAVSELPGAPELVRAAKRLSDALRAPWTAVHVETARDARFDEAARQRLADTLALAAQLGATTAVIPAQTIVEGLKAYTTDARATQLVVGKSARSRLFELRHGSVVDRLVRETPGVTLHVLPMDEASSPPQARRSVQAGWGDWRHHGYVMLMVAAVTALAKAASPVLDVSSVDLLYLLPVMASASLFGLRPGLVAGLASALAYNFFFTSPFYTFRIDDPKNVVTVIVLLGVAFVTSQLAGRVRVQADLATRSARQNAALAGFSRQLTALSNDQDLAHAIAAEIARLFDARAVLLLPEDGELAVRGAYPPENMLGSIEMAAAGWAMDKGQPAGRGSDTLPAADWLFQPLKVGDRTLGVLGLAREDSREAVRSDQLPLLHSLLDQTALVLERVRLEGEMRDVAQLRERDRLRAALLSSVSHDLRTPLTTILASTSQIRAAKCDALDPAIVDSLETEAERLNRFVANLLDMARVEAGALRLVVEPIDLTDAVTSAVHDLRRQLGRRSIGLEVPPDLPLVRADPQLFHHCLINLLDNAAKYSGEERPITVRGTRSVGALTLAVLDEGPGLPPGQETRIFETFARLEGSDRQGGTGLGLAIVKGFAEAMGLEVSAGNRSDGSGAVFTLRFPEALIVRSDMAATL